MFVDAKSLIKDLASSLFGKAKITDDTQMTMFTADGLIKALRGRYVKAVTAVDIGIPINNKEDFFLTDEEWKALGLPPDLYIYEGAVTYYR